MISGQRSDRRNFRLTSGSRQLKVELPWVADYVIVTNLSGSRVYMHSGSGEIPNRNSYDYVFPELAKSQDGVNAAVYGLQLGEPGDTITETVLVSFVRGESVGAMGSIAIRSLAAEVTIAPGQSVGIDGTPPVAVPGGVDVTNTPAVTIPGGTTITGTPPVSLPGGTTITGTPPVSIPGAVTANPVQLNGVLQTYANTFGTTGPSQINFGWYDLNGWGGAVAHFENTGSVDFLLQWYVSPNAGGSAIVAKSWTIKPGQTFTIRVPKLDRYVLFAVFVAAGSIAWAAGIRATQETILEPSIQTLGSVSDWISNNFTGTTVIATNTNIASLAAFVGYEVMAAVFSHGHSLGQPMIFGLGNAGTPMRNTLFYGQIPSTFSTPWLTFFTGATGGILILSGVNDILYCSANVAINVFGALHVRRRLV